MKNVSDHKAKGSWRFVVIGWTLYATFMTVQSYVVSVRAGRPVTWEYAIVNDLIYAGGWALLTPVVLMLARRFPLTKSNLRTTIPLHLGASFAIALLHKFTHGILVSVYRLHVDGVAFAWDHQFSALISFFDYGVPLYWILILLNFAFDYYTRYKEHELRSAQLESQLAQAQLQALKMQLHPHFLFNTLNAISVLVDKDPRLARQTVGRLSDLLRYTLDTMGAQKVTLREELDFLERYLQIEQTRFGERLTVVVEIDDDVRNAIVPNMILQPLVENAIKHGIGLRRGEARIEVRACRSNGSLHMTVCDNGTGLPDERPIRDGVGLSSTRARLRELYGEKHEFTLSNNPGGGANATVTIPFTFSMQEN